MGRRDVLKVRHTVWMGTTRNIHTPYTPRLHHIHPQKNTQHGLQEHSYDCFTQIYSQCLSGTLNIFHVYLTEHKSIKAKLFVLLLYGSHVWCLWIPLKESTNTNTKRRKMQRRTGSFKSDKYRSKFSHAKGLSRLR